jgi:aryl-alcohol dehydrogenase-like predicted oxidoreductase
VLEALKEVSDDVGRSPAGVAIRWVIDCGVASSVIVGAKTPNQVLENWGAQSWSLSRPHLDKLKMARRLAGFG